MDGWPHLVPPPADWNAIDVPPEAIHALGVGPSIVRARVYFMLGESLLRRTKAVEQDAAIYSYVMAHVLRPEAAAYINLGVVLRQSGRIAAARSAFNQAVAHTPGVSAAFTNLALLPGTAPEEAAALLQRAVSLAPSDGISYASLAGALKRRGDQEGARAAHALSACEKLMWESLACSRWRLHRVRPWARWSRVAIGWPCAGDISYCFSIFRSILVGC